MPKQKNKFKGYTYEEKKEIQGSIAEARELLRQLHNCVTVNDHNTDHIYFRLSEKVESLYGELDLHNLIQDNQRRERKEKERVRKAHG